MATLRNTRRGFGFTLIEMLIALVLAGVITAIALPAYSTHVNRGRVAKAIADIKTIEMGLERYMTASARYPANLAEAGITVTDPWGRPYPIPGAGPTAT